MPRSAISIGGADFVYSPKEIATKLKELISEPELNSLSLASKLAQTNLEKIISYVSLEVKIDFNNYKEPTLMRQIYRRMTSLQINSIEEYERYLFKKKKEVRILANHFLVCVTSFFRDKEAFETFKIHLYELLDSKKENDILRIWVAACATGEEVYTIGILILEYLEQKNINLKNSIFATDINQEVIDFARIGAYTESVLSIFSEELIKKFFSFENSLFHINKILKNIILFAKHDLTKDTPFLRLDIQAKIMSVFHYSLNYKGFLFLGKSESVRQSTNSIRCFHY